MEIEIICNEDAMYVLRNKLTKEDLADVDFTISVKVNRIGGVKVEQTGNLAIKRLGKNGEYTKSGEFPLSGQAWEIDKRRLQELLDEVEITGTSLDILGVPINIQTNDGAS